MECVASNAATTFLVLLAPSFVASSASSSLCSNCARKFVKAMREVVAHQRVTEGAMT
jgi:hypothetical protein